MRLVELLVCFFNLLVCVLRRRDRKLPVLGFLSCKEREEKEMIQKMRYLQELQPASTCNNLVVRSSLPYCRLLCGISWTNHSNPKVQRTNSIMRPPRGWKEGRINQNALILL
jgi:hypothetical protein